MKSSSLLIYRSRELCELSLDARAMSGPTVRERGARRAAARAVVPGRLALAVLAFAAIGFARTAWAQDDTPTTVLDHPAGQAFYIGPTAYFQLSPRSRLTASWSIQAWGRPAGSGAALDLVNFERHQARLVFGVNF